MDSGNQWKHYTYVAMDTETTGQYPLTAELCEIAAVKWRDGEVVEEFQTLVKPTSRMSDFVIGIHHITNEMVEMAPLVAEKIHEFHRFISDSVIIAHHAPFDLGFLAIEFEQAGLELPSRPVLCSSLLGRKLIPESPNHRLQTLVSFLNLPPGQAHRALDDARACLRVAQYAMDRVGPLATLNDVYQRQQVRLEWKNFSIKSICSEKSGLAIVEACRKGLYLEIVYQGGSRPGNPRQVKPSGLVRSPDGDYLIATDYQETQAKRFYLAKITSASVVY